MVCPVCAVGLGMIRVVLTSYPPNMQWGLDTFSFPLIVTCKGKSGITIWSHDFFHFCNIFNLHSARDSALFILHILEFIIESEGIST